MAHPLAICSRSFPMNAYIESFLPLFVAINGPGIIPIYLSVTEGLTKAERWRLTLQAMMNALVLAVLILFAGQLIFSLLGEMINHLPFGCRLSVRLRSTSKLTLG